MMNSNLMFEFCFRYLIIVSTLAAGVLLASIDSSSRQCQRAGGPGGGPQAQAAPGPRLQVAAGPDRGRWQISNILERQTFCLPPTNFTKFNPFHILRSKVKHQYVCSHTLNKENICDILCFYKHCSNRPRFRKTIAACLDTTGPRCGSCGGAAWRARSSAAPGTRRPPPCSASSAWRDAPRVGHVCNVTCHVSRVV